MTDKKFLPVIKVGGRRVVKKPSPSREASDKLRRLLETHKTHFSRSSIDEVVFERNSKLYKYKSNIKVVFDSNNTPIGILVNGLPDVRSKIVLDVPEDFEMAVENLNKNEPLNRLEEALGID